MLKPVYSKLQMTKEKLFLTTFGSGHHHRTILTNTAGLYYFEMGIYKYPSARYKRTKAIPTAPDSNLQTAIPDIS